VSCTLGGRCPVAMGRGRILRVGIDNHRRRTVGRTVRGMSVGSRDPVDAESGSGGKPSSMWEKRTETVGIPKRRERDPLMSI
jgi:hypothetical protein